MRGLIAGALFEPHRPLLAHLVVTRRCNLSCGYCHEYDDFSPPVPADVLRERIDHLARLRTVIVTLTGGEPLLHPRLPELVAHVRARGMTAALNTNGFLLDRERIEALGQAGLYAMQISLDGERPNDLTKKALRPLLPKLRLLAEHARFRVRVNTVLGAAPPEEALAVVKAAAAFGFEAKCSLMRHGDGSLAAIDENTRAVYDQIARLEGRGLGLLDEKFQHELVHEGRAEWKCRAGARFFHVCERGLVHLCAPRYGAPGVPLASYGSDDLRRAFRERKPCTARCPVAYAHQTSQVDRHRSQKAGASRTHLPVVG